MNKNIDEMRECDIIIYSAKLNPQLSEHNSQLEGRLE